MDQLEEVIEIFCESAPRKAGNAARQYLQQSREEIARKTVALEGKERDLKETRLRLEGERRDEKLLVKKQQRELSDAIGKLNISGLQEEVDVLR